MFEPTGDQLSKQESIATRFLIPIAPIITAFIKYLNGYREDGVITCH